MPNIKVYISPASPPCRSVLLTVNALGLDVDIKKVDMEHGEHKTPEYLKMNPDHTVPTIADGDFSVWESRAIMRYLVGRYGGGDNSLYPKCLKKRAVIDILLDKDLAYFFRNLHDNQLRPSRLGHPVTEEMLGKVTATYEWFENLLKGKTYLAGDKMTIADLAMVVSFMICETTNDRDMNKYPNSMAWYKRMQELPYFKSCNQGFYAMLEMMKSKKEGKA